MTPAEAIDRLMEMDKQILVGRSPFKEIAQVIIDQQMAMKRFEEAKAFYAVGLEQVKTRPAPKGQKFPLGSRVRIADDLGPHMEHFESGKNATVMYTYAHAYGGTDVKSYCLDIDGVGEVSWYEEYQLTPLTTAKSTSE